MNASLLIRWGIYSFVLLAAPMLSAQQEPPSYYFEGDDIVFQFDSRAYQKATLDGSDKKLDFADLDIYSVAISGSFNDWARNGWKMKKVGTYTYQLRKPVKEINGRFNLEFKFIINRKYWVESDQRFKNRVYSDDFWEDVFNLSVYGIEPDENGNTVFRLPGFLTARQVILSGSFNGWNETYLKMNRVESGWELRLDLAPGRYEYKFIADGEWLHDPTNLEKVRNEHRTYNSVLKVTKFTLFVLDGYLDAKKVVLSGSFNDWNEHKLQMNKAKEGWSLSLPLVGGKHHYKFIVDGKWLIDPKNPYSEFDWNGNENSVLIIQ